MVLNSFQLLSSVFNCISPWLVNVPRLKNSTVVFSHSRRGGTEVIPRCLLQSFQLSFSSTCWIGKFWWIQVMKKKNILFPKVQQCHLSGLIIWSSAINELFFSKTELLNFWNDFRQVFLRKPLYFIKNSNSSLSSCIVFYTNAGGKGTNPSALSQPKD